VLVVQSPSLVLALFALLIRPFFSMRVVIDAHNESVTPFLHSSPLMRWLTRLQLRAANLVIVTNAELVERVREVGGTAVVLTDAIPEPPQAAAIDNAGTAFRVVIISSFAADEPIEALLRAAARCGDVQFYMTGNPARLSPALRAQVPPNLTLTGFLKESRYWGMLQSCDAVLDLTLMPDCLVCGAYEAIALGKPLILSNNRASLTTFATTG
jgi:glycosyltransferase involved in cell wall biosynthesis